MKLHTNVQESIAIANAAVSDMVFAYSGICVTLLSSRRGQYR